MVMAEPQSKSKFIGKVLFTAVLIGLIIIIIFEYFVYWEFWSDYLDPSGTSLEIIATCFPNFVFGFNFLGCAISILGLFAFIFICLILSWIFWKIVDKLRTS